MTSSDYRKLSVLLSNIKSGSRDAFASVYKMYEKKVYFLFCKILGSKSEASKMTIDLFDHVYLQLSGMSDPMDFEKWLYLTLFSRARRYLLDNRPEVFGDYIDTDSVAGEEADILLAQDSDEMMSYPDGIDISVDMMKTVDSILSELPLKLRVAVLLYYFCGFDMDDIAATEHISLMAVKNRLLKARIRMKTEEHKYTEIGYDCVGLVVFLPEILSVMADSIVIAANVASGVTARTGIRCISADVQQTVQENHPVVTKTAEQQQFKSSNYAPTSYAVPVAPKKKVGEDISPSVKVLMAIVAILIIIGGTVAVVLAVQNHNKPKEPVSIGNIENTEPHKTIDITTKSSTTETTTEPETTTQAETETTTEITTATTTQATTETTTEVTTEATTAETTIADVQQPEPDGDNLPDINEDD